MPIPTLRDAGTFQPALLRDGVRLCGLLRAIHTILYKAGRRHTNLSVQVAPGQEGPVFFQHPSEDLSAHQRMALAGPSERVQALCDSIARRLASHEANDDGWFAPRFALSTQNLLPLLYVPGCREQSRLSVPLRGPGDLGRALALTDLVLAHAGPGKRLLYVEAAHAYRRTGAGIQAAEDATALMLAWAWRYPTDFARTLAGGTMPPHASYVEKHYGLEHWRAQKRLEEQHEG